MYRGLAEPVGHFPCRNEALWFRAFKRYGWDPEYVGDHVIAYDFVVQDHCIEVKPEGDTFAEHVDFVSVAAIRAHEAGRDVLIVSGRPGSGFTNWFSLQGDVLHKISPTPVRKRTFYLPPENPSDHPLLREFEVGETVIKYRPLTEGLAMARVTPIAAAPFFVWEQ
jgi:hypothetical protein